MDKLLIVDDEEIEREGMANLIDWPSYGIELVGTAWNGVEGLEKIKQLRPDIVFADVKMPGMDGIQMIHQARETASKAVFVVLSGYGEYEFTSRAMEEGVRHYLLKPCSEDAIAAVIGKVQAELAEQRAQQKQRSSTHILLPRAREQIFRELLLGRDWSEAGSTRRLIEELGGSGRRIVAAAFRLEERFDYQLQFILCNMMNDLLPEGMFLLSTGIERDIFVLADACAADYLRPADERLRQELHSFAPGVLRSAASSVGTLGDLPALYQQAEELLYTAESERREGMLRYGEGGCVKGRSPFDYPAIRNAKTYEQLLFELHFAMLRLRLRGDGPEAAAQSCRVAWRLLAGDAPAPELTVSGLADALAQQKGIEESQRGRRILLATYEQLCDPGISLRLLARKALFMNEDYLGRVFSRLTGMRFSAFVECRRISFAQRLLQYQPELRISQLAGLVGYPEDGQYFSKAFRKLCGETPSEYRDRLKADD